MYDASQIRSVVDRFTVTGKVIFASSCAEWLFPGYEEWSRTAGAGDFGALRLALDTCWMLAGGGSVATDEVDHQRRGAALLVPDDDAEGWTRLSPLAANAAAGVEFALATWLSNSGEDAQWASYQVYEAADYVVQFGASAHSYVALTLDEPPISMALSAIERALDWAGRNEAGHARRDAETGGRRFREWYADDVGLIGRSD